MPDGSPVPVPTASVPSLTMGMDLSPSASTATAAAEHRHQHADPWASGTYASALWVVCFVVAIAVCLGLLALQRAYFLRKLERAYGGDGDDDSEAYTTWHSHAHAHSPWYSHATPASASMSGSSFFVRNRCRWCNRTWHELRAIVPRLQALADMARAAQITAIHEAQATRGAFRLLERGVARLASVNLGRRAYRPSPTPGHGHGHGHDLAAPSSSSAYYSGYDALDLDLDDRISLASSSSLPSITPTVCERPGSPGLYPVVHYPTGPVSTAAAVLERLPVPPPAAHSPNATVPHRNNSYSYNDIAPGDFYPRNNTNAYNGSYPGTTGITSSTYTYTYNDVCPGPPMMDHYQATVTLAAEEIGSYLAESDERRARAVRELAAAAGSLERAAAAIHDASGRSGRGRSVWRGRGSRGPRAAVYEPEPPAFETV